MKLLRNIFCVLLIALATWGMVGCDEASDIGSGIAPGEVEVFQDSSYVVTGVSVYTPVAEARSLTQLLGRLSIEGYGDLECEYVTQLLAASQLNIPDSIKEKDISGMKLKLHYNRGAYVGDSLAPQQVSVYELKTPLQKDILSDYNPTGNYYTPALGVKSYTGVSVIKGDTLDSSKKKSINIDMPLPLGIKVFNQYRNNPATFEWIYTFNDWFKGLYVSTTFGRGFLLNVSTTEMVIYWQRSSKEVVVEDGVSVTKPITITDSLSVFVSAPEVLTSNIVKLKVAESVKARVAQGQCVLQSPCGYNVKIHLPADEVYRTYLNAKFSLAVVNDLSLTIPVSEVATGYGLTPAPELLMVRTSKLHEFFSQNMLPDDKIAFWGTYDSTAGTYKFSNLRSYILDIIKRGEAPTADEMDFTLMPVNIGKETNTYTGVVTLLSCTPYMNRPTICVLDIPHAKLKFTFSKQLID